MRGNPETGTGTVFAEADRYLCANGLRDAKTVPVPVGPSPRGCAVFEALAGIERNRCGVGVVAVRPYRMEVEAPRPSGNVKGPAPHSGG